MNRIYSLDLLRALAIIVVMLVHLKTRCIEGLAMPPGVDFGWMGVDLFFVLSGFLIGSQLFAEYKEVGDISLSKFYFNRTMRILPAYLTVLLMNFTIPAFNMGGELNPLWQFLTFTVNIFGKLDNHLRFTESWSLCVEEHFYLLFPLIVIFFTKLPSIRGILILTISIIIFGIFLRAGLWMHYLGRIPYTPENENLILFTHVEYIYLPTYNRLDGLLAGVILACVRSFRPDWWQICMNNANKILLLGIFGLIFNLVLCRNLFCENGFLASVFGFPFLSISLALIVLAAMNPKSIIGVCKIPFATTIATLAYSLYLTHIPIFKITTIYLNKYGIKPNLAIYIIYTVTSFGFAALLYFCIERPFLKTRNRILHRHYSKSLIMQQPVA